MNKQLLAFEVMTRVKETYTDTKMTDSVFAKTLTEALGEHVSTARVRQARLVLGIPGNGAPKDPKLAEACEIIKELVLYIDAERSDESFALVSRAKEFVE